MEEVEKMAALKKAYADIILNTAKEAATRIMISEQKAVGFQQDLLAIKDEALNMLVRLKQMSDSKVTEAEIESLIQRKRIEELEVQLHEAKAIERDLRSELKGAQTELEKVKNNAVQPLNTCELPQVDSRPWPVSPGTSNACLSQINTGDNCCSFDDNTDLASIIMRSKNPELYKNGCTQRIRALERNLKNGNTSNPGQTELQFSGIKDESTNKEDGAAEGNCNLATYKDENMCLTEKNLTKQEGQTVNFLRRSSRKRRPRYSITEVACTKHKSKSRGPSFNITRCKTYPSPNNNVELGERLPMMIQEEEKRKLESHLVSVSSLNSTNNDSSLGCKDGTNISTNDKKLGGVQTAIKDIVLIDGVLFRHNAVAKSSGLPDREHHMAVHASLTDSDCKDEKKCTMTKFVDDKLLKYAFTRKRKKDSLSSPGKDTSSPEKKITAKRRSGEKQKSDPEPEKPTNESSRDSRRLAQVARQLISLSEKRW